MLSNEIKTVEQLLNAWDKGETIWSVELGGLGPGYEQAIQVCAVEIARKLKDYKPTGTTEDINHDVDSIVDKVVHEVDEDIGGMSGAMVGQAKWLAWQWCHNGGPANLQRRAKEQGKEDDCIQVCKAWPKAP